MPNNSNAAPSSTTVDSQPQLSSTRRRSMSPPLTSELLEMLKRGSSTAGAAGVSKRAMDSKIIGGSPNSCDGTTWSGRPSYTIGNGNGMSLATTPSFLKSPSTQASIPSTPGPSMPDDYAMRGLADVVRAGNPERNALALGTELTTLGLAVDQNAPLAPTFGSPWTEVDAGGRSSLDRVLPICYYGQPAPPVASKLPALTDDTLFYIFYSMPRDRLQELAARELTARNWWFHKDLRVWLMRESVSRLSKPGSSSLAPTVILSPLPAKEDPPISPTQHSAMPDGSPESYILFDPITWTKVKREALAVAPEQVEDRFINKTIDR